MTAFTLGDQFGKRRAEVIGVVQAAIQLLRDEMIAAAQATSEAGETEPQSVGAAPPGIGIQPGDQRDAAMSFRPELERAATIGPRSDGGGMAEFGAARPVRRTLDAAGVSR